MEAPTHRWASGITLAAILAVGISPYLFLLPVWPHSWDATVWIVRGAVSNPDWAEWVFKTNQFNVGYRPVTAISYTLDNLVGGYAALPYRLTDFLLHLGCAVLTYLLYRRIAPHLPSWGGLVSSGIVLAHPVTEQVVPHLARRSYPLATFLSLAALVVLAPPASGAPPGGGRGSWLRSLFAGVLLALALLANEASVMALILLPWLALCGGDLGRDVRRRLLLTCGGPVLFVGLAIVLRSVVLGGFVGGYTVEFDRISRFVPILTASWRTLGAASSVAGPAGLVVGTLLALATAYYLWRSASPLIAVADRSREWLLAVLALWVGACLFLFASLGVWFPRQAYVVLVPFALVVGVVGADTFRLHFEDRRALVLNSVPQALLVGWILLQSPILHGVDPARAAAWRKSDQVLREMYGAITEISAPAEIRFAVPHFTREPVPGALRARADFRRPGLPARRIETWIRALDPDRELAIESLVTFEQHPLSSVAQAVLTATDPPRIELPAGALYATKAGAEQVRRSGDVIRIDLRSQRLSTSVPQYFYFHDGSRGTMIRLDAEQPTP